MTLDTRWKNPQGKDLEALWRWAQDVTGGLRKGDFLAAALGALALAAADITFANTQRVLGRNTASGGPGEEVTLSQFLDWIGSAARGDLLVRGAATWSRLGIGSANRVLTSDGTDPSWQPTTAGGVTTIASGSLPAAATLSITSIPETYAYLMLKLAGVSSNTATRMPLVRVSTNNGSTYDSNAAFYVGTIYNASVIGDSVSATLEESVKQVEAGPWGIRFIMYCLQLWRHQ